MCIGMSLGMWKQGLDQEQDWWIDIGQQCGLGDQHDERVPRTYYVT